MLNRFYCHFPLLGTQKVRHFVSRNYTSVRPETLATRSTREGYLLPKVQVYQALPNERLEQMLTSYENMFTEDEENEDETEDVEAIVQRYEKLYC